MLATFAHTGGLTGAEVGVAAATGFLNQKLLTALFGEAAMVEMIQRAGARLDAELAATFREESEQFRALLASCEAFGTQHGVRLRTSLLTTRDPDISGQLLREATKRKADLIVLGTHGRRGLRRLLLGSDAEMVVREARVPVLLVRATDAERGKPAKVARKMGTPAARKAARRKDAPGAQA